MINPKQVTKLELWLLSKHNFIGLLLNICLAVDLLQAAIRCLPKTCLRISFHFLIILSEIIKEVCVHLLINMADPDIPLYWSDEPQMLLFKQLKKQYMEEGMPELKAFWEAKIDANFGTIDPKYKDQ